MRNKWLVMILLVCAVALVSCGKQSADDAKEEEVVSFLWEEGTEAVIMEDSWSPRVYTLESGKMLTAFETAGGICVMQSTDKGNTWANQTVASFYDDLACANPNLFQLEDGSVLLAYRAIGERPEGYYTSLQVSISQDDGATFTHHSTVIDNIEASGVFHGVWEPCLGYLNGVLTCFYANDSTAVTILQNIEYKQWDGTQWNNRTVVSEGLSHNSRDGMPVWISLKDGGYACVMESSCYRIKKGFPFVIQLLYSADGITWSDPVDVYYPTTQGSKAGAPGIVELPNGQIVISFQTDEDVSQKGDAASVMKTIISDGSDIDKLTLESFTESDQVFDVPAGAGAVWSGIWYSDGVLYATAGTPKGSSLKQIQLFEE